MTTEVADATATEPPLPSPAARKPRPRGRTAIIMTSAVVLGVLGGGAVGYDVQYNRAPTPLPSVAVAQPQYPLTHATRPPLSPADDDMVKTDGDLTKLLLPAPSGATPGGQSNSIVSSWNIAQYAEQFVVPGNEFSWLADHGFRRAANANWDQGNDQYCIVNLVQFTHADEGSALQQMQALSTNGPTWAGGSSVALQGSDNDVVFAGTKSHTAGANTYYEGQAFGVHGDIAVEVDFQSGSPVSAQTMQGLLQKQMGRL